MVAKVAHTYNVGDPVYALYFGPRRDKEPRWVPAVITKRKGTHTMNVRVYPRGPTWHHHIEQLQPRYISTKDTEPGMIIDSCSSPEEITKAPSTDKGHQEESQPLPAPPASPELEPQRPMPRRSSRSTKGIPPNRYVPPP